MDTNLVGLDFNLTPDAISGLYVVELPDIVSSDLDFLTRHEGDSTETAWERLYRRTERRLTTLFMLAINEKHHISSGEKIECLMNEKQLVLAPAFWYLLGESVMQERLSSSRFNGFTTIERSKVADVRDYCHKEFLNELERVVMAIDIHSSECFAACEQPAENAVIRTLPPVI